MRVLLDRHPLMTWCGEFEFAIDLISDAGEWPDRATLVEHVKKDRVFNHWRLQIAIGHNTDELIHDFLVQWASRSRKPLVGVTVHRHLDRIPTVWPNARYIHILRDPRDVALSMVAMGWDGNVWKAIDRWMEVEDSWARLRSRLAADRWIEVRFEDLIRSPEETLSVLCRFLGIDFDPSMTSPAEGSSYSAPDPSLIEQWRRKLSPRELRWIESKAGAMMLDRGYEPTDRSAKPAGPIESIRLRLGDRFGRASHARRTLGTGLWLESIICKRIGSEAWRDSVRRRLHAIAEANLK